MVPGSKLRASCVVVGPSRPPCRGGRGRAGDVRARDGAASEGLAAAGMWFGVGEQTRACVPPKRVRRLAPNLSMIRYMYQTLERTGNIQVVKYIVQSYMWDTERRKTWKNITSPLRLSPAPPAALASPRRWRGGRRRR